MGDSGVGFELFGFYLYGIFGFGDFEVWVLFIGIEDLGFLGFFLVFGLCFEGYGLGFWIFRFVGWDGRWCYDGGYIFGF